MKVLFAPWRLSYLKGLRKMRRQPTKKKESCVFCEILNARDDDSNRVVYRGQHAFVMLNRYPYSSGHMMVLPLEHGSDFSQISPEAHQEIAMLNSLLVELLHEVYNCDGMNFGMNIGAAAGAGLPKHLHYHLIPRWNHDHNLINVVGETRVIPEALEDSYKKIRPLFFKMLPGFQKRFQLDSSITSNRKRA